MFITSLKAARPLNASFAHPLGAKRGKVRIFKLKTFCWQMVCVGTLIDISIGIDIDMRIVMTLALDLALALILDRNDIDIEIDIDIGYDIGFS